jgi:C1A family cysteine protease
MKTEKMIIFFTTLFLCFGLAANVTAFENDSEPHEYDLPVMWDIPPKSEKTLEIMDPDPQPTMSFDDLPPQFSWKNYNGNWLTPVKDQAYPVYCGSCYIFAAWSIFEAAIDLASGYPTTEMDLSEQYGLSCINAGCNGCGGGWGSTMIDNIVSTSPGQSGNGINGVPIESCMPYQADDSIPCDSKCSDWDYYTDPPMPDNKLWQIENWGWTSSFSEKNPDDWNTIKSWLYDKGPLAVTIAWDNGIQNFVENNHNPSDVYEQDSSDHTNHLITLCGWVDDPEILNGGYWILKNSHVYIYRAGSSFTFWPFFSNNPVSFRAA